MEMVKHVVPWEPLDVMILADIQWAGYNGPTAINTFKREIQRGVERKCKFMGGGDYIDFMSPSNRQSYRGAKIYDTARQVIADQAETLTNQLHDDFLKLTAGHWLGLVEGHHLFEFPEGDTSDMRLCRKLRAPFLGTSGYINLTFQRGKTRASVNIWLHHGAGSCQRASGQLNKLDSLAACFEADVLVMAHYTQKPQGEIERVYPVWTPPFHIKHKIIKLVGAGGFGRGYQVGARDGNIPRGNYVEKGALRPVVLGAPIIRFIPREQQKDGRRHVWVEIRVEA